MVIVQLQLFTYIIRISEMGILPAANVWSEYEVKTLLHESFCFPV